MAFNRQKALEKAEKYAAKGQHDKAAREYRSVVDDDPKDIRAWLMLADCLVRCGNKSEAVDRYLKVAESYAGQKQPQKAVAVYRQVLNLDPSRLDVQMRVAGLNRMLGRIPDAVAGYELVAQAQMQTGHTKEALNAYRLAADAEPSSISKRLRLAELYSREKLVDEAIAAFRVAAMALLSQGRREDYVRVAERLIYHKKDDLETLRELSSTYLHLREPRRALMKLNALLHVESSDPAGLELLADTFGALEKTDKAVSVILELAKSLRKAGAAQEDIIRVLRKGAAWEPENAEVRRMLDDLGVDDEDVEEIEELDLDEADMLALDDDDMLIEDLDEEEAAEEDDLILRPEDDMDVLPDVVRSEQPLTQSVLDDVTGNTEVGVDTEELGDVDKIVYEARVYVKYKLYDHALEHIASVLEEEPGHAGALGLRARAYRELGRMAEAAESYLEIARAVVSQDPKLGREHLRAALECAPGHAGASELMNSLGDGAGVPQVSELEVSLDTDALDVTDLEIEEDEEKDVSDDLELALDSEPPVNVVSAFEGEEEDAFGNLEESGSDELLLSVEEPSAGESEDFSIDVQEGEPKVEAPVSVEVENRFGLSEARPLPQADDDQPASIAEPTVDMDVKEEDWPDISDELAEIRFFADQGLDDDVEFSLGDLDRRFPGHPEVVRLRGELAGGDAPPPDEEAAKPLISFADEDEDEDAYLAAIFSDEPSPEKKSEARGAGIGARADIDDADAGTYFDLGTAYREMGLVDDAIAQFELAATDANWRAKSLVMIGALRVHRGETDRAIVDLEDAIQAGQTRDELCEAHYELGMVFAKVGDTGSAISHMEQVDEGFRDREERLAELRG